MMKMYYSKNLKTKVLFIAFVSAMLLASCSDDNQPTPPEPEPGKKYSTMLEALQDISVIDSISTEQVDSLKRRFKEHYVVYFSQPADHQNSSSQRFRQKVCILFRGFDCPTILSCQGYDIKGMAGRDSHSLSDSLNANIVAVEHRNFGTSKILPKDLKYETLEQESADLHTVFTTMKKLLPGKWMSSGVSKGGETSIYYNYMYTEDMDLGAAFCSPFLTSLFDVRAGKYMFEESGSVAERLVMRDGIKKYLENGEQGLYKDYCDSLAKKGEEIPNYSEYVFNALEVYFWAFSYSIGPDRKKYIPNLYDKTDLYNQWYRLLTDNRNLGATFYGVDCSKWQGFFKYDFDAISSLLEGTSFNERDATLLFLPKEDRWVFDTYDNYHNYRLLNNYLPSTTKPTLFVYSKDDPWTGARPERINPQSIRMIINPNGIHNDRIYDKRLYSPEVTTEILTFLRQYIY